MAHGRPGDWLRAIVVCAVAATTVRAATLPLTLAESPASSGFFSATLNDAWETLGAGGADDWSFEAEAGDVVSARIETTVGNSRPRVRLLNAANVTLYSMDGVTDGIGTLTPFTITTPGTYRVRVYTDHEAGTYALRVDLGRGARLEGEPNDGPATANRLTPLVGTGEFTFSMGALAPATDTAGDYFQLGQAPAGSELDVSVQLPGSSLTAGDLSLRLLEQHFTDRSLDLTGSTYAAIPHHAVFDAIETANTLTIEAWVMIQSYPASWYTILSKHETTGDTGWLFAVQNGGGGISFYINGSVRASADVTPSSNAWHHLAVAYDHGANEVRFYLDGALVATRPSPGALTNTDGEPAYIGLEPIGADQYSDGPIAELRLWNRALSTAEIAANYLADLAGNEANLVGLWRFDEGTGATADDASATANDALLGNGDSNFAPAWTSGAIRPRLSVAGTTLNRTFPAAADTWLHVAATANRGLNARYHLGGSLADATNLGVTSLTLPAEGSTTTDFIQAFTVTFNDELDPVAANDLTNFDLRIVGDDEIYPLVNPGYANGTTLNLALADGPLQPGNYRFTVGLGLRDRFGNPPAATFVRNFTVQPLGSYRVESRANNTLLTATSLAATGTPGAGASGGWFDGVNLASGGNNPYGVATGDFNNDGDPDLVSANYNGSTISVLLGNGDGTFAAPVTYPAANNPFKVVVGDLNGDARPDVVATRRNGAAIRVYLNLNDGTGALAAGVDYATGAGPHWLVLRDLDGDTDLDVATANFEGNNVSVLANNGNGTFAAAVNTALAGAPHGIAAGDLNGDGRIDLAVATRTEFATKILYRQLDGSYLAGPVFAWAGSYGGESVAIADLDGDGRDDVIGTVEYGTQMRRWHQQVDGTLAEGAAFNLSTAYGFTVHPVDYDGDSDIDLLLGRNGTLASFENRGAGVFVGAGNWSVPSNARQIATGDFNGDSRVDLVTTSEGNHAVRVYLARASEVLAVDGTGSLGLGRGNLSSDTDVDYFSFSARAGDRVIIGSENITHLASTGRQYRIYRPEGDEITSFATNNGTGQTQFVAPVSGVYSLRVETYYVYTGEYRFAVALIPSTFQLESEGNDSVGAADGLSFTTATGTLTAAVAGYVRDGDPGDVFALGFLDEGTTITLEASRPPSSNLSWILEVLNNSGAVVAAEIAGATTLNYAIPVGQAGNAFARIRASTGADLFAQYRLAVTVADSEAPAITADTLPAEGTTVSDFFGHFALTFSETLQAASVNALANYELRAAGADTDFDTEDDELYSVALNAAYASGLSAGYYITDGPLQPGSYRFRANTGLLDLYLNPLSGVYERTFTIGEVAGFVFESRSNDTAATATSLAGGEGAGFGGSWRDGVNLASGGNNPYGVATGDFDNDGELDLVSANFNGSTISVLLGNGDGTFAAAVTYPAANNPFKLVVGDLNGDARPDVVATRRNGAAIRVYLNLNDGTGALAAGVDYATGAGPHWLVLRDLDGDTDLDVATANYEGNNVSVLANNGNGTFAAAVHTALAGAPHGIAAGDLNGDGRIDLAVATRTEFATKILYRQLDGSYLAGPVFTWAGSYGGESVAIADLDGDGRDDVIGTVEYGAQMRRWHQQVDGTLVEGTAFNLSTAYGFTVHPVDYDGDSDTDLLLGRNGTLAVFENRGAGVFFNPGDWSVPSNARQIATGDFNGDNRVDLVTTSEGNHAVRVYLGRGPETLAVDGTGRIGFGRGSMTNGSDLDYFTFSARAGDRVIVGSETPGHPGSTGRQFRIYRPEGGEVESFATNNGTGQGQFVAPVSGVYLLRVEPYYTSTVEYRFAVSVIPGNFGLESEGNDSAGAADGLAFTQGIGSLTAGMGGAIRVGDPGDWFALGFLAENTQIMLGATRPPSSNLVWILDILNSSSAVVATGAAGDAGLVHTVAAGQSGNYYARIRASTGAGLTALYQLSIAQADIAAPAITGDTLPAEGATVSDFFDRFTLSFSENLQASAVNDVGNYDLRAAGDDTFFGTPDDEIYSVTLAATYSSGLSASYFISDGPLQPGSYRFEAHPGLRDLYLNPIPAIYTRLFTVEGVAPYVFESRSNNTFATATSLAALPGEGAGFAGSWRDGVNLASGGNNPYGIATGDFNNDGDPDLVSANYNGNTISVLLGNGDGTFAAPVTYPAANNPFKVVVGDLNGDARPDVVVTRRNGAAIRVYLNLNDGTGALAAGVDYATGAGPHWLVLRDLDGDTDFDVATANYEGNNVSLLYNNGNGTFAAAVHTALAGAPHGIAAGDLNGDGRIDLAVATRTEFATKILYRQADNTYAPGPVFAWAGSYGGEAVAIGDLNGDTRPDLVGTVEYGNLVRRWYQQADGSLEEASSFALSTGYGFALLTTDYDDDDDVDLLLGRNGSLLVYENLGGGTFTSPATLGVPSNARQLAVGDFSGDGRPDLATTSEGNHAVRVFLGRGPEVLPVDGSGGLGLGRGNIANGSDFDLFSFSALAGERVIVTSENPAHAGSTGLQYRVSRPEGEDLATFATNNGSGQTQFVAPVTGVYHLRVEQYYGYAGEYRFAVMVFPEPTALESEGNDSIGAADSFVFVQSVGMQTRTVAGVLFYSDPADWTALGNLAVGTQITVSATKPPSSNLVWLLDILDSSSAVVANGAAGATPVTYTIPAGQSGAYYVRIRANSGADLLGQYRLNLTLADDQPPTITGDTLPPEGGTITSLFDRFTLNFSEDMQAATVNAVSSYDLRAAGDDTFFDTEDDIVVPLVLNANYASGLAVTLRTANGATLPVGSYRFRAGTELQDLYLNALAPVHTRLFHVGQIAGYTYESEPNGTSATASNLPVTSSQPDLFGTGARGNLLTNSDVDFWSFDLQAGDQVQISGENPGNPGNSGLNYQLFNPAGGVLVDLTSETNGQFTFATFTAADTGTYQLRVAVYYGYNSEYRFRINVLRGGLQLEVEANNTIGTATGLTLVAEGNNRMGSIFGVSRTSGELDYFHLGTLDAGTTIFLSTRQPGHSTFQPVVSLYTGAGVLLAESTGGRAGDGVAQVPITVTGTYYALVRTSGATGGLAAEYILDALVVPTADVSFPNLQVTSLTPPAAAGLASGDATTISFRVDNLGNLATAAVTWIDRIVLSTDQVYGNADDLELAALPHNGPLGAAGFYVVTNTPVTIPDGISGDYHVIVRTDHTNTVAEFVLEGDNETTTDSPLAIALADYPDLVIENLAVSAPDGNGVRTATWTLANRGLGTAAAGFDERFLVRNTTSGVTLVNEVNPVGSALAADGTLARSANFSVSNAGTYSVEVTADALSERFEFEAAGHAAAETNNLGSTTFAVTQLWTITAGVDPAGGGTVAGGGTFAEGSSRTVTVTTNQPYVFLGWFEDGFLRSTNASYTFTLTSDRTLTARFSTPSFVIGTQVAPAAGGVVTGGGLFPLNTTVDLVATPSPGYTFVNWTEGATPLGANATLSFPATAARTIVANFAEANPTHAVTLATSPAGVAVLAGTGNYTNVQNLLVTAPATVVDGTNENVFQHWTLNGAFLTSTREFTKVFSTLDAPALAYVAVYDVRNVKPVIAAASSTVPSPLRSGRDVQIVLRFDRAMNPAITPVVTLSGGPLPPAVPAGGAWSSQNGITNNTYTTPAFQFAAASAGTHVAGVTLAQSIEGGVMDPAAAVLSFVVDGEAPPAPVVTVGNFTNTTATLSWTGYAPPPDLSTFRIYRESGTFATVAALTPVSGTSSGARTFTLTGLAPDTDYFAAVVAVDEVGNFLDAVTPLTVRITSTVPPPVPVTLSAPTITSALLDWTAYDTAALLGFDHFSVFRSETDFTSVAALTPITTLPVGTKTFTDAGRDRTKTYYYAVVGVNRLDEFNPAVTTAAWTDPLAEAITSDLTLGGPGAPEATVFNMMTVQNGATLTVLPGTTLRFAPNAGITVQSGRLIADGEALAPIHFTSLLDGSGTPAPGDWDGIILADPTQTSVVRHVRLRYGQGLSLDGQPVTLEYFAALFNAGAGLEVTGGLNLAAQHLLLAANEAGVHVDTGAQATISNAVLKNNTLNAFTTGTGTLTATGNWWGVTPGAIAGTIAGNVDAAAPLAGEPVLLSALGLANAATVTSSRDISLRIGALNASAYRLSEDAAFTGILFSDVPDASAAGGNVHQLTAFSAPFTLSVTAGLKTVFVQLRSVTGEVGPATPVEVEYTVDGPAIAAFNFTEGQVITRPYAVSGSATSALGITALEFYVDDVLTLTSATGTLAGTWDVRPLAPGARRVKLVARDTSGTTATRERNVQVTPTPPTAPAITSPLASALFATSPITVSGTAEPGVAVRITRNAVVVANVVATGGGTFSAPGVTLTEGDNTLIASAYDAAGSSPSAAVTVSLDSGAPGSVTVGAPAYDVLSQRLRLAWEFGATGERAQSFRVFWHSATFSDPATATGQSAVLTGTQYFFFNQPAGVYYFGVVGYDSAGNASPLSNIVSAPFDATPPVFTISYGKPLPAGPGLLPITLQSDEDLGDTPILKIRPAGKPSPLTVTLTAAAARTWTGSYLINDISANSGAAEVTVSGRDLAQNLRNATLLSPPLVIDITRPTGVITLNQPGPIGIASPVTVSFNVALSEPAKPGTTPEVRFQPPTGTVFDLPVVFDAGTGTWVGNVELQPAMGDGIGTFLLSVDDAQDNSGTVLTGHNEVELFTGATPPPPGAPSALQVAARAGGVLRLTWNAGANATSYNIYREAGAGGPPTTLLIGGITTTTYDDVPPADGAYRYVVKSERLDVEGGATSVAGGVSDRTPPDAPTSVEATLLTTGVRITFGAPAGETPASYVVRRGATTVRTLNTPATVNDAPPRGVHTYSVAAADALGNEASASAAPVELLVGAVGNLQALARDLQAPVLTWTLPDNTAVGVNIYRDGVKVNAAPLPGVSFTDTVQLDVTPFVYVVRAVNAAAQESAPRTVTVRPFNLELLFNVLDNGQQLLPVIHYFDTLTLRFTNLDLAGPIAATGVSLERAVTGDLPLDVARAWVTTVAPDTTAVAEFVVPAADVPDQDQFYTLTVETGGGDTEGTVAYEQGFTIPAATAHQAMIEVSAPQTPLAGGLTTIRAEFYNRGGAPMDIVLSRQTATEPGDVYVAVIDANGVEVSRHAVEGAFPGMVILPDGRGYLRIAPGASAAIDISGVLVPAVLADAGTATFRVVVDPILHGIGTPQEQSAGPLSGAMQSGLVETPYFGTSATAQPVYTGNDAVVITGQAINRASNNPEANAPLKIGFSARGFTWYQDITADGAGNFSYTYFPPTGFAGRLRIWTAHPDVFDQLTQTTVDIFRLYLTPQTGEIRMSKNDTFDFTLNLINPGDVPLTGFTAAYRFFTVGEGGVETPVDTVTGVLQTPPVSIGARLAAQALFRLTSTLDAPDSCLVEITVSCAEGASATFRGNLSLLPAVPILAMVDPAVGYVDVSVNRGQIVSRQVTIENRGQRDLTNVELVPPANVGWFQVDRPVGNDGKVHLPDIPIGGTVTFGLVFTPPTSAPLGYTNDTLRIRGDGAVADFEFEAYALVTSAEKGNLLFTVENTLVQRVPGATIRLRNTTVNQDIGPFEADANGQLLVNDIQEGTWSWQVSAPGHQTRAGTVEVVAAQTADVYVMLHRALVSVRFSVVPVPFTDRYEIKIEQTFETHVPFPVLVFEPPRYDFGTVEPGFETTVVYNLTNKGLVRIDDVVIRGTTGGNMSLTPLISYIPSLQAMETVQIPARVRVTLGGAAAGGPQSFAAGGAHEPAMMAAVASSYRPFAGGGGGGGGGGFTCNEFGMPEPGSIPQVASDAFGSAVDGAGAPQIPGFCESGAPSYGDFVNGLMAIAAMKACGDATCGNGIPAEVVAGAFAAAGAYQAATSAIANIAPVKILIGYLGDAIKCLSQLFSGGGGNVGGGGGPGQGGGAYSGGSCCFPAGTPVRLADGSEIPVEMLRQGMELRADNHLGSARLAEIVQLRSTGLRQVLVRPIGTDEIPSALSLNGEHRVWHVRRGWVQSAALVPGDWLRGENDTIVEVVANDAVPGEHVVYSFHLVGEKAAYVGGLLVEDLCEREYLDTLGVRTVAPLTEVKP